MAREIILKSLGAKNFKGLKELNIQFGKETNIFGENGTGKTTLFDAFNFAIFDKDSEDRTKFDVQPLDKNNNVIHHLETEIEASLDIDGQEVRLRKIYKEKWTKTRGKAETELKGCESFYYINDVPQKQNEYKAYIQNLIDENTFKLVTNPMYFAGLNWKKRREILMDIIGDLDIENVVNYNNKLEPIRALLSDGIDNFMKATKEKIKRLKKDREQIPTRIDEANNSIKEYQYEELELNRKQLQKQIDILDEQIADSSKAGQFLVNKRNEMYKLKALLQDKTYKAKIAEEEPKRSLEKEMRELNDLYENKKYYLERYEQELIKINEEIEIKNKQLKELRAEYKKIKDRNLEFDENRFICPTCQRQLEENDIENQKATMENSFNKTKARDLENNMAKGKDIKAKVIELESRSHKGTEKIKEIESEISTIEEDLERRQGDLSNFKTKEIVTADIEELKNKIVTLEKEIDEFKAEDNSQLRAKKSELQSEVKEIDKKLATKELNEQIKVRISDLQTLEKELSSRIAKLEGEEILGEEFIRTKVELLEETVNKKFKYVTFKLFNNLNNGGLEECCEPVVNGVPFTSNLNTAAKINAGIDIINTLSNHYDFRAPIFVDNRESVNELIDTSSQVISLIVSKDKELRVEV